MSASRLRTPSPPARRAPNREVQAVPTARLISRSQARPPVVSLPKRDNQTSLAKVMVLSLSGLLCLFVVIAAVVLARRAQEKEDSQRVNQSKQKKILVGKQKGPRGRPALGGKPQLPEKAITIRTQGDYADEVHDFLNNRYPGGNYEVLPELTGPKKRR